MITVLTPGENLRSCERIEVSGASSDPGNAGAVITAYDWTWLFAPATLPVLTPVVPGDWSVIWFESCTPGVHILALDVTNDCGARSQASAVVRFTIGP